jgi:large subunit ribosomal protein L21
MEGDMYAIIRTGGKQYRVSPGQRIEVESLSATIGETVEIGDVLLLASEGEVLVGQPTVPGVRVRATVVEEGRGRRVTVFKFRSGNRYQRKLGHRQSYTTLLIEDILRGASKKRKPAPAKATGEKKPAPAKVAEEKKPSPAKKTAGAPAVSIEELGLPSRVAGALKGAGLETVEDLLERDEEELLAIRGFGAKSLEQVRTTLKDKGFIKE